MERIRRGKKEIKDEKEENEENETRRGMRMMRMILMILEGMSVSLCPIRANAAESNLLYAKEENLFRLLER